ncbi:Kef-type potassium/proton antiporter (CPA2 family) [Geothermobacter ehrlichii]|uniref:Kef-type potassium/proton antiporter (CPA2 family) n=1 Tax=Geothermobacter ehrlichii TaxID=213224 RepID=A0A5D3WI75_9BACT|nr:monovalent cation:proton antiporter family protein [Geothermobacter ehrlichii]TYO97473.1 Kef-type potassium/proton antiporter (CPA2 family) [Geothermobacter ehrlichii]
MTAITLQDILVLLGLALAIAFFCSRIKLSPIVGYLLTGLLAGPYGFHLIRGIDEVEMMAEIGVIMLLFTIGLEFSVSRILRLKGLLLKCGITQVLLTGLLIGGLAGLAGLPAKTAVVLGMALALSSTAIVLKLLLEKGELDSAHGRIALSVLLFQDLGVIFFLVALPLLGGKARDFTLLGAAGTLGLLAGLFVFSRYLLQPLLVGVLRTRTPELFRLTILVLVLGTAWTTHLAGLSLALGAFLAGLALAESDYSHQALSDIIPFRDTFLAIFFISMGMLVNVRSLIGDWALILGLFLILGLLKAGTASLAALWSRFPLRICLLSGLILFQVGEFSFILLRQARSLQLIPEHIYQITLFVITLSMMATPLLFSRAGQIAEWLADLLGSRRDSWSNTQEEQTANLEGHVVIAGYGLAGRNVGRVLKQMRIPCIHIELNGEIVRRARERGELIVYGDATSRTVLERVGIERARALVLAINDPSALASTIQAARELNDRLYILVRTRFVLDLDRLCEFGADEVIPDEFEASLQMAACLLRRFAIPEGKTLKLIASLRQEHYGGLREPAAPPADLAGYLSVLREGRIEFRPLPEGSPCLGRTLAELQFRGRTGAMVVGVVRKERILYNPAAELRLEEGDTLMLLGASEDLDRACQLLHGELTADGPAVDT